MESFYEENTQLSGQTPLLTSGGALSNGATMKRPLTLDLNGKDLHPAKRLRFNNNASVISTPDLQMLKMVSPELEKFIMNGNPMATPTPGLTNYPQKEVSWQIRRGGIRFFFVSRIFIVLGRKEGTELSPEWRADEHGRQERTIKRDYYLKQGWGRGSDDWKYRLKDIEIGRWLSSSWPKCTLQTRNPAYYLCLLIGTVSESVCGCALKYRHLFVVAVSLLISAAPAHNNERTKMSQRTVNWQSGLCSTRVNYLTSKLWKTRF